MVRDLYFPPAMKSRWWIKYVVLGVLAACKGPFGCDGCDAEPCEDGSFIVFEETPFGSIAYRFAGGAVMPCDETCERIRAIGDVGVGQQQIFGRRNARSRDALVDCPKLSRPTRWSGEACDDLQPVRCACPLGRASSGRCRCVGALIIDEDDTKGSRKILRKQRAIKDIPVERVTFHNEESGFCVLRIKARGHRELVTVIGHAAVISAGE